MCLNPFHDPSFSARLSACIGILLLGFSTLVFGGETNFPRLDSHLESRSEIKTEHIVGDMILQKIHGSDFALADPVVNEYLRQLAEKLNTQAQLSHVTLDFFGVDTPEFNAFAFFGGHVAVHSGLILAVENESELAAVLAHETAHISQRHLARILEKNHQMMPLTMAELMAAIAVGVLGAPDAGVHLATAALAGHTQQMINFTRSHEQEADRIGMKLLAKAKFDPKAMASVFARIKKQSRYQETPPEYLLTHPVFDARIADAQNRAASFPAQSTADSPLFYWARARLAAATPENTSKKIEVLKEHLKNNTGSHPLEKTAQQYSYALLLIKSPKHAHEGMELLKKLLLEHPAEWVFELSLAEAEYTQNHLGAALTRAQNLAALHPKNYAIALQYINLLLKNNQGKAAIPLLLAHRKAHIKDPALHQLLARAYSQIRSQTEVHRAQAEWHLTRGEFKAALKQLELALEHTKPSSSAATQIKARQDAMNAMLEQQQTLRL